MSENSISQVKKPKIFYGYIVVIASLLILVAMIGSMFTFGVFLTPMLNELGWGNAVLSGALSTSILLSGFLGILPGKLSDKFGPRRIVLICNLFYGTGFILMSQVHSIWQLYLFYGVLVAIGLSTAIAPLQSTIVKWFVKRRGLIVAVFLMGLTAGNIFMPPTANWLILTYGWRTAYVFIGIVSSLIVFIAAMFLKSDPSQIGQLPDGADKLVKDDSDLQQMVGLTFRQAFRTVQFWLLCVFFFCIAFAMMVITTHIIPHAINIGNSSTTAAIVMSVIGGFSTAAMIPEGFMADHIGIKKTAVILTILLLISMLWISLTGDGVWSLFLFAIIFGIAFSSLDILLTLLSTSLFGLVALGTIIGFVNSMLQVGGAVGPFVGGLIFDSTGSYKLAFVLCAVLSFVAVIITFLLKPTRHVQH